MRRDATAPPLYPDLQAEMKTQTQEEMPINNSDQNFRLKQIHEIRDTLENETETRGRLRRRYKSLYNSTHYLNIASSLTSVAASTAAVISVSTVVGALAALPLGIVAISSGVIGVVSSKISKLLLKKCEKHERVKLVAMSKLSSVSGLVSRALTDGKISDEEFQVILNEMDSYREHKSQIRRKVRNELSPEREEEIREEALKKGVLEGQEIALSNLRGIMSHTGPAREQP
tara:strand:- start:231 stop:920 length:690 start_codon:yes stop_codon:yes gene_type:complete